MGRNSIWERGCIRFGEIRRGNDSLGKSNRSEFVPEINRFRRGYSFEKSRANESLFLASAFAEFLTYMASLREGSRGEEVTAMGGWQWGRGWRDGEDRFFTSLRYVQNDMLGVRCARKDRGGVGCRFFAGDGSPHSRGQRVGVGSRFRLRGGGTCAGGRGWGWVPASGDLCITVIPALSQNPEVGI